MARRRQTESKGYLSTIISIILFILIVTVGFICFVYGPKYKPRYDLEKLDTTEMSHLTTANKKAFFRVGSAVVYLGSEIDTSTSSPLLINKVEYPHYLSASQRYDYLISVNGALSNINALHTSSRGVVICDKFSIGDIKSVVEKALGESIGLSNNKELSQDGYTLYLHFCGGVLCEVMIK